MDIDNGGEKFNFYDLEAGGGVYKLEHNSDNPNQDWYINRYSLDGYWVSSYQWDYYRMAEGQERVPNATSLKTALYQEAAIKAAITALMAGIDPLDESQ